MKMACETCGFWCLYEQDEEERAYLQKDVDKLHAFLNNKELNPGCDDYEDLLDSAKMLDGGYCKRFPPTLAITNDGDCEYDFYAAFPITRKTDMCGEFKRK